MKNDPLTVLPQPSGPYRIGIAHYDLEDAYRKEIQFPEGRLIPIQIYFPTEKGPHEVYAKIFEERADLGPFKPLNVNVHSQKSDLSFLANNKHPLIFLNHGSCLSMTDYAFLAEDLSSHGYVVISIQHNLISDEKDPPFWEARSCSGNAKIIDNMLYVFEWLKTHQSTLFKGNIDLKKVGFVGHSLGANSLLFFLNRTLDSFQADLRSALLSRIDQNDVKECFILLDATRFSFPINSRYPLFFLFSQDRETYHQETGCYQRMVQAGHKVHYYKGATHISFMDHAYVNPQKSNNQNEEYFNGNLIERMEFFNKVRQDIRNFLAESGIASNENP